MEDFDDIGHWPFTLDRPVKSNRTGGQIAIRIVSMEGGNPGLAKTIAGTTRPDCPTRVSGIPLDAKPITGITRLYSGTCVSGVALDAKPVTGSARL